MNMIITEARDANFFKSRFSFSNNSYCNLEMLKIAQLVKHNYIPIKITLKTLLNIFLLFPICKFCQLISFGSGASSTTIF